MDLHKTLTNLTKKKAFVLGDLMVDHYTHGVVSRISPEAPVPVLLVSHERILPGGAGNVMVNLTALGIEVFACGRLGNDPPAQVCLEALKKKGVDVEGVVLSSSFQTPVKTRMIAQNQQILRVDCEQEMALDPKEMEWCFDFFKKKIKEIAVVVISDYAKGFCTQIFLQKVIQEANLHGIPVVVDPKSNSFSLYRGATLIKPNFSEAAKAAQLSEKNPIEEIAERIFQENFCRYLMITRSEKGIFLFEKKEKLHFPAAVHEVKDVTGAGDTVCAVIAFAFAHRLSLESGCFLANLAAGYVVERLGCIEVSKEKLLQLVELQQILV